MKIHHERYFQSQTARSTELQCKTMHVGINMGFDPSKEFTHVRFLDCTVTDTVASFLFTVALN